MHRLLPWFTLQSVPGVGALLYKRLIDRFGSARAALAAPVAELVRVPGVTARLAAAIGVCRATEAARREIAAATAAGVAIVALDDPAYPPLLGQIPDPPPLLYVRGRLAAHPPAIAVVGTRNATDYGLGTARRLAAHLAHSGLTVVSGMALGIDTAAHEGALEAGGITVAVLGSGLGRLYPPGNRRLATRIARSGAVISELPMTAGPDPHHFPRRNRIISGLCLGTVVVEAGRRSGALITARLAAEQNREVFAVPGSIRSFKSAGTHGLIRQGAKLVEHAQDILEEFPALGRVTAATAPLPPRPPPDPEAARVLDALDVYPVHIDALARDLAMPSGRLAGVLLTLELDGRVVQWPGKRFTRRGRSPGA